MIAVVGWKWGRRSCTSVPAILSPSAILTSLTDDHEASRPVARRPRQRVVISGDTDEEVRFPTSVFGAVETSAFACSIPMETSVTSRSSWAIP